VAEATKEGREKRESRSRRRGRHRSGDEAIDRRIRKEVAELTVIATEKLTRKALTGEDQKRLVEEALGRGRLLGLSPEGNGH